MTTKTAPKSKTLRAVGVVRVSQTKGREGESFASPKEQADRIRAACKRDSLKLSDVYEELDVSGGAALEDRPGLGRALEAVESGKADVIVAAYFDRIVRSLRVQEELLSRVESAGGKVLAVDVGQVTNGSAGQWVTSTMLGMMSEYQRRAATERSADAQARAVARGVPPWPRVTSGYYRASADDPKRGVVKGQFVPDPKTRGIVAQAFTMRAEGTTVEKVREYLRDHGIKLSFHGVTKLLKSPVVLGEIHFGKLVNLSAFDAIVDRETWRKVQRVSVPRGRRAKSDRLLARLGVLRCATCGARMVVGTAHDGKYHLYRCPYTGDCAKRAHTAAGLVEDAVVEAVRAALADVKGRASTQANVREAAATLEKAQADLDAALRAFAGLEDESAARERLMELRRARDAAQERVDQLGDTRTSLSINAAADWDTLSLDARRALIRATVEEVTVKPGRGPDRITVKLFSE